MKHILIATMAILIIGTTAACSRGTSDGRSSGQDNFSPPMTISTGLVKNGGPSPTNTSAPSSSESGGALTTSSGIPDDRMIVRTGNMSLVVDDINTALANITQIAEGNKGYVVSSNSWKDGERVFGSISIRIPTASFDIASRSISQMAVEVTSQNTSSQDVTEEYVDLSARLSNLKVTEQQLLLIMAKADKVTDILAVQAQLTNIQSQIEQIKGKMQYLEKTSATSLITVSLAQSKLQAKFTASSVNSKTGDEIQFSPDVAGGFTPYSYEWEFGDGKASTESNPVHVYAKTGQYTISLKITDDRGNTVTETRKDYIKITQGGWSVGGVVSGAWAAMLWLGRALLTVLIGLAVFSPAWIVIGAVIWWLRRRKTKAG